MTIERNLSRAQSAAEGANVADRPGTSRVLGINVIREATVKMVSSLRNGDLNPKRQEFLDQFRRDRLSQQLAEALWGAVVNV